MDSAVERMMKESGVEVEEKSYCRKGYCNRKPSSIKFGDNDICRKCPNGVFYKSPIFTAGKQIELLQLLGEQTGILYKQNCFFINFETNNPKDLVCVECDSFDEGLAEISLILKKKWKVDCAKVKEILER